MQTISFPHQPIHRHDPAARLWGIGLSGLLNAVFFVAIAAGLVSTVTKAPDPVTTFAYIEEKKPAVTPPEPPNNAGKRVTPEVSLPPIEYPKDASDAHAISIPLSGEPRLASSARSRPPYPEVSRRLAEEGTVRLLVFVDEHGLVTDVQIIRSSGYPRLDSAAASWIKTHWRYEPLIKNGRAVPAQARANVEFTLR